VKDLSLHILDIAENSIAAAATEVHIELDENAAEHTLTLKIRDNGRGMDPEAAARAEDPFFTTKKGKKTGLGISLLGQSARQTGGSLQIRSRRGSGTEISAVFITTHPDMKPLGDISGTLTALIAGNPSVRFIYDSNENGENTHFDTGI
jgi:signal transduction histidine kinase